MTFDEEALSYLDSLRLWKPPEVGDIFGRQFADFGCELFIILPNQMLSLMSGKLSSVKPDESFFYVPTMEEILKLLYVHTKQKLIENIDQGKLGYIDLLKLAEPYLAHLYSRVR